jgi:hypothetical protein
MQINKIKVMQLAHYMLSCGRRGYTAWSPCTFRSSGTRANLSLAPFVSAEKELDVLRAQDMPSPDGCGESDTIFAKNVIDPI